MRLPLMTAELDALADRGGRVPFWLRDDDATEPSPALDRLLALDLPVVLAVIPSGAGQALADRLADAAGVLVAQHGWAHANHAGAGEKKQELGAHRPLDAVTAELAAGFARLSALFGPRFLPLMVPPWNRIAPRVVRALPGLGFRALSVYGAPRPAPLAVVNPVLDPIDWRGTRGCHAPDLIDRALAQAVQAGGPVGVLTHHLAHRKDVWRFLAALKAATVAHPAAAWVSVADLVPGLVAVPRG